MIALLAWLQSHLVRALLLGLAVLGLCLTAGASEPGGLAGPGGLQLTGETGWQLVVLAVAGLMRGWRPTFRIEHVGLPGGTASAAPSSGPSGG